jgi:hypothetical protein
MIIKNLIQNYLYFFIVILLQLQIQIKTQTKTGTETETETVKIIQEQKSQNQKSVKENTKIKSIEENIEFFFDDFSKKDKNLNSKFLKEKKEEEKEPNILLNYFSKQEFKNFIFDIMVILENFQGKKEKENLEFSKKKDKGGEKDKDNESEVEKEKKHKDSLICKSCLSGFKKINWLLQQKFGFTIFQETLAFVCSAATDYYVCRKIIKLYSPEIFDALLDHYFDAEYICTYSKICTNIHYKELNADDYARYLLKDKPQKKTQTPNQNLNSKRLKFVHITDIHFDSFYEEVN